MSMHMSMMYEKKCCLVEPVVTGLEGVVSGSILNPNCLLSACSCHCVSGLVPRRQSCSESKLVCEGKCYEVVGRPLVVSLRVPYRSLVKLAVIP